MIEASAQVVWSVITEPAHISSWFSDEADVQASPGADGTLTWKPGGRGGEREADLFVPIQVVDAEPYRRFSFRWNHPGEVSPNRENSALVEFSLSEEKDGTRLRVIESGIAAVTDGEQERARYFESHEHGWEKHLSELREHIASSPIGQAR